MEGKLLEQKRKPHGFAITQSTLKRVRIAAAENDMDMGDVAERALVAWLDRKASNSFLYAETGREAHDLLEYILENGNADDRHWIIGNLRNFSEAIRSRKRPRQSSKP